MFCRGSSYSSCHCLCLRVIGGRGKILWTTYVPNEILDIIIIIVYMYVYDIS
jgi:hypothetical protein